MTNLQKYTDYRIRLIKAHGQIDELAQIQHEINVDTEISQRKKRYLEEQVSEQIETILDTFHKQVFEDAEERTFRTFPQLPED